MTHALSRAICPRTTSLDYRHNASLRSSQHVFHHSVSGPESWHSHNGIVATRTNKAYGAQKKGALAAEILMTPVEKSHKTKIYAFPIGKLLVRYGRSRLRHTSREEDERWITRVETVFIPPRFLSNTMIRAGIECSHTSTYSQLAPTYSLQPISVNRDPELFEALYTCDLSRLKSLFLMNYARLTDMIIDYKSGNAITLLEVNKTTKVFGYCLKYS